MALWFLAGIKRHGTVALASSVLEDLGVSRYSEYRALRELEDAGLITVDRRTGRNPVVTILDAREGNEGGKLVAQSIAESLES
jgi:DNA-binding transcriptional ArsR family regulator